MRDILFRGKRVDNGEWAYGWFEMYPFTTWPLKASIVESKLAEDGIYAHDQVDHKTIGEYTGLHDKNGRKIFEGDLCYYPWLKGDVLSVIIFECGEFRMQPVGKYDFNVWTIRICGEEKKINIIGNIHDNPELLDQPRVSKDN